MNEQQATERTCIRRIAFTRLTPLWFDALLLACVVHMAFVASLHFGGWPTMVREWMDAPSEPWWWAIYFLPTFLLIYIPALIGRRRRRSILLWSTVVTYFALKHLTPRIVS